MQKKSVRLGLVLFLFLIVVSITFIDAVVLFESDWSTALGATTTARLDGVWPSEAFVGDWLKVIEDSDFPSGRALYVGYHGNETSTGVFGRKGSLRNPFPAQWPEPAVGQTLFHRFYYKNNIVVARDLSIGGSHPFEGWGNDPSTGTNCAFFWEYRFDAHADGTFHWNIALLQEGSWTKSLNKFQVYLMEVAYTRQAANSYTVRARLDGVDISTEIGIPTTALTVSDYCLRTLFLGNNDPGYGSNQADTDPTRWRNFDGSPVSGGPYMDLDSMRWASVAVAVSNDANAWIGPYNSNVSDTTPPVRSSGLPSVNLSSGTTQTNISLSTDENATCKYDTTSSINYSSMTSTFSTTGGTSHSQLITGLSDGNNFNYYVRCNDSSNNFNTNDFTISFGVDIENQSIPTFTYNWSHWYTNETTNFSLYNTTQLQDIGSVKFVNQHGTINFLEKLNLSKLIYDLRNRIRVFSHKIWVNSSLIPEFNKSAQLTFRDVGFTNPIIKVDGVDCPATVCQNISFNSTSGEYVFNVTAFSVFEVVEQCEDGIKNYDETGVDCGGSCGSCLLNSNWIWVIGIVVVGLVVWGVRRGKKRKSGSRKKRKK